MSVGGEGQVSSLVEDFRRACRGAQTLRRLLAGTPAARELLDQPLFPFDAPALVHVAGGEDGLALVDVLLEFGADPNRRSDWWAGGFHALHCAKGPVADRLLAAGAAADACAAAHLDRLDLLQGVLDDDPARVHERGGDGQTPLHFARSRAAVDLLLERGADLDARDVDHRATPAQWMLDRRRGAGRYELASYLVERGATADVFLAAALGKTDLLRELIESDPSLLERRTKQDEYGEQPPSSYHIYTWTIGENLTPLQAAEQFEQQGALEVMRELASPRLLFVAACSGARAQEARRLLRRHPALLAELTPADRRALPDAGWAPDAPAVELMLELGFDPTVRGLGGATVLHASAWEGSVPCVQAVLRHAAARSLLGEKDPFYGGTPLGWCCHGASNCGSPVADHAAVARLLLEAGAEPLPSLEGVRGDVAEVIRRHRVGGG